MRAAYEEVEVIHGIDATFEEGGVTAVLGANGAGKSTLLALAAGIMGPSEGEVRFAGEKVRVGSTAALARRGLCLIPEGRGVFPNLTVRENLWVMTHSGRGRRHVERARSNGSRAWRTARDQPAGTLSGGEQQMLALARAVATSPRLLMLDELSMGLAPIVVDELYKHVVQLAAEGITVVVVEQFARTALAVASSAMVMANGRIVEPGRRATWSRCSTRPIWDRSQPAAGPPAHNGTSGHTDAATESGRRTASRRDARPPQALRASMSDADLRSASFAFSGSRSRGSSSSSTVGPNFAANGANLARSKS